MKGLLSKHILVALIYSGVCQNITAQSLPFYHYDHSIDVLVVFTNFCDTSFVPTPYSYTHFIDTSTITGFNLRTEFPEGNFFHKPNTRIFGAEDQCQIMSTQNKATFFKINHIIQNKLVLQSTLFINKIDMSEYYLTTEKYYTYLLSPYIKYDGYDFIAILVISLAYPGIENRMNSTINVYKLVEEINMKNLISWAESIIKHMQVFEVERGRNYYPIIYNIECGLSNKNK